MADFAPEDDGGLDDDGGLEPMDEDGGGVRGGEAVGEPAESVGGGRRRRTARSCRRWSRRCLARFLCEDCEAMLMIC